MSDQTTQNFSNELVEDCVVGRGPQVSGRGQQALVENKGSNDTDTEITSPWKYPSFNSKKKGTVSLFTCYFCKTNFLHLCMVISSDYIVT